MRPIGTEHPGLCLILVLFVWSLCILSSLRHFTVHNLIVIATTATLKGQCHKIFASGFFHESSSPKPPKITLGSFQIFPEICGDIHTGVNYTGGKFATGINDTGGKFCHRYRWCCWYWWKMMGTISDCWHHKVNLKEKTYLYVNSIARSCSKKIIKTLWLKIFFICHWCQRHQWCTLSCEYLREFSKKFETALMVYSGAWGKLIHKKPDIENLMTLSL